MMLVILHRSSRKKALLALAWRTEHLFGIGD
jgi:hypothetical protein